MSQPVLVALAGRPGVGKSTLARALVTATGAVHLRVDTIEHALQALDGRPPGVAGYAVLRALAADNLRLGNDVVADSVNPLGVTREAFADCARAAGARLLDVEVVCSDEAEHRRRIETRAPEEAAARPDWAAVTRRPYDPWETPRIVLDTARRSVGETLALLLAQMER